MLLHFDFTESATRKSVLDQVRAYLDDATISLVDAQVEKLNVPDRHHGNLAEIRATIDMLNVSERVRGDMRAIYQTLTEAEATVHETAVDAAHFHEVGRAAGIRNVAEICLAIEALSPERITATPVQAGCGTVKCAHGVMPVPAPATAVILDGCALGLEPGSGGVPTCETRLEGERVTPTSAAIIKHFVQEFTGVGAQRTYFQGPVPEHPHNHTHGDDAHGHTHAHDHAHPSDAEHDHGDGAYAHNDDGAHDHVHAHDHGHVHVHDHAHEQGGALHQGEQEGTAAADVGESDGDSSRPFSATPEQHAKLEKLKGRLRELGCVAVAFSGGVDSTFLLAVAHEVLQERAFAVTAINDFYPARETELAQAFCRERGIYQLMLDIDPFEAEGLVNNPENRCYLCKRNLFVHMLPRVFEDAILRGLVCPQGFGEGADAMDAGVRLEAVPAFSYEEEDASGRNLSDVEEEGAAGRDIANTETGMTPATWAFVIEGSNATDRLDYRPGAQAVREAGVLSPLDEADLTKQDIRDLSRELGLSTWRKPSFACLATRFVYGETITPELLHAVDLAEQLMIDQGFAQVRVRVHDDGALARVEVPYEDLDRAWHVLRFHGVAAKLHELGFKHVSLDVDGYRTGSMN